MKRERVVKAAGLIFGGMILYFIFSFFFMRYTGDYSFKYDFLFLRQDRFMDFFNVNWFVFKRMPYDAGSSYPPFALIISYLFTFPVSDLYLWGSGYAIGERMGQLTCIVMLLSSVIVLFYLVLKLLKCSNENNVFLNKELWIITFVILSCAPFIFLIDRGNYLIVALIFFFLFVLNYEKEKNKAAIFIALAAAIKLYPVIFFVFFLFDKKFKSFFVAVFSFIMLTLLPLIIFKGGFFYNLELFINNVLIFSKGSTAIGTIPSSWFSISLKPLILLPILGFSKLQPFIYIDRSVLESVRVANISNLIYGVIALFSFVVTWIIVVKEKILWKRVLAMTIFMILIPSNSYDYNLTYLMPSFLLFLISKDDERYEKQYIIFYALLFIPKAYYYINQSLIGIQSLLDPLILLSFLCFVFYSGILERRNVKTYSEMSVK